MILLGEYYFGKKVACLYLMEQCLLKYSSLSANTAWHYYCSHLFHFAIVPTVVRMHGIQLTFCCFFTPEFQCRGYLLWYFPGSFHTHTLLLLTFPSFLYILMEYSRWDIKLVGSDWCSHGRCKHRLFEAYQTEKNSNWFRWLECCQAHFYCKNPSW